MLTTVHPYGAHSLCVCVCVCVYFCLCLCVCFPVCSSWLLVYNLQFNEFVKTHTASVWSNWTDSFWLCKHDFKNLDYCYLFLFFFKITLNKNWKYSWDGFFDSLLLGLVIVEQVDAYPSTDKSGSDVSRSVLTGTKSHRADMWVWVSPLKVFLRIKSDHC